MSVRGVTLVSAFAGLAAIVAVSGFWFHTSPFGIAVFDKYAAPYFLSLCVWSAMAVLAYPLCRALLTEQQVYVPYRGLVVLKPAKKILAVVLGAVALVGVGEIFLQRQYDVIVGLRQKRLRGFHPYLQLVPDPGDPVLHVNRWGFRGEDIERRKPPGAYRIFVMGGSTVFCEEVSFEDTHARLLEKKLRGRYPGRTIEVQNAGMHWYASQHSVMNLLFRVQDFDPDLVILYHAANDLYRSFSPRDYADGEFRSDYAHYLGPVARMVRTYAAGEAGPLVVRQTVRAFADKWFSDFRGEPPPRPVPVDEWRSLETFEDNLRQFVEIARSKGAQVVLASQPYLYHLDMAAPERAVIEFPSTLCEEDGEYPDTASMIRGMDAFNAASARVAAEASVPFVDLEARVPKTREHFVDDFHYTEAGNRIIAQAFFETVVSSGLLDDARTASAGARRGSPDRRGD